MLLLRRLLWGGWMILRWRRAWRRLGCLRFATWQLGASLVTNRYQQGSDVLAMLVGLLERRTGAGRRNPFPAEADGDLVRIGIGPFHLTGGSCRFDSHALDDFALLVIETSKERSST